MSSFAHSASAPESARRSGRRPIAAAPASEVRRECAVRNDSAGQNACEASEVMRPEDRRERKRKIMERLPQRLRTRRTDCIIGGSRQLRRKLRFLLIDSAGNRVCRPVSINEGTAADRKTGFFSTRATRFGVKPLQELRNSLHR